MRYHDEGFYSSELFDCHGIFHGFGTRRLGSLSALKNGTKKLIVPSTKQVHGTEVHFFDKVDEGHVYVADAWLTSSPGITCFIRTADCLPLLICDVRKKVIGAIHAGWRGIAAHIVKNTLSRLFDEGSRPEDIIAAIGPRIRQDCYEVGADLMKDFIQGGWSPDGLFKENSDKFCLSMACAVIRELESCGVSRANIDVIKMCTYCDVDNFYSYRREPGIEDRQLNFIFL